MYEYENEKKNLYTYFVKIPVFGSSRAIWNKYCPVRPVGMHERSKQAVISTRKKKQQKNLQKKGKLRKIHRAKQKQKAPLINNLNLSARIWRALQTHGCF